MIGMGQGPPVYPLEKEDQEIRLYFVPSPVLDTWMVSNAHL